MWFCVTDSKDTSAEGSMQGDNTMQGNHSRQELEILSDFPLERLDLGKTFSGNQTKRQNTVRKQHNKQFLQLSPEMR